MLIENGRMSERQIAPVVQAREKGKVVSAREAVRLIRSGDTIATGGFVGIGFAEEIAVALEELSLAAEDAYYHGDRHEILKPAIDSLLASWRLWEEF